MRSELRTATVAICALLLPPAAVAEAQPQLVPAQAQGGTPDSPSRRPRDPLLAKYLEAHLAGRNAEALQYLTQAADAGNADAQPQLAGVYRGEGELGKLVTPDPKKTEALFASAIAHGSTYAMEERGVALMNGSAGRRDYAAAFALFSQARQAGSMKADRYLGMFYQNGWSVPVDNAKAVSFHRAAAELGDITSQCLLGAMYERGMGVGRSDALAEQWYRRSAERGDHIASGGMAALAHLEETLTDGKRDAAAAADWYAKAAAQRNVDGQAAVKRLASGGAAPEELPADLCVSPAHH